MCYGGHGQMQQAAAAGIPPSITGSGQESEPDADSTVDAAQASQNAVQLTGLASCYNLEGRELIKSHLILTTGQPRYMERELSGRPSMCTDSMIAAK
ncbi:MAG: hypothetical protein ABSH41_08620 [Syntrophobacteraceae bacterium]